MKTMRKINCVESGRSKARKKRAAPRIAAKREVVAARRSPSRCETHAKEESRNRNSEPRIMRLVEMIFCMKLAPKILWVRYGRVVDLFSYPLSKTTGQR
jgi:hypothetical protein